MFKAVVISLLVGASATTLAEYIFRYNLVDLIVEKVRGWFSKEEKVIKSKL